MKITKSQLKQILKEEMEDSDSALLAAISDLASTISDLDVSIDYLSSAVTGEDAMALGYAQSALGRMARSANRTNGTTIRTPAQISEIEDIIEQEIEEVLSEKEKYKKSFYKAKEKRAEYLVDKGVPEDQTYGVADKQMSKAGKKKKKE